MLDTFELSERLNNLHIQQGGNTVERAVHDNAVSALVREWQRYLADQYAAGFTVQQQAAIYTAAGDPDLAGYHEVEAQYQRYANFARTLLQPSE